MRVYTIVSASGLLLVGVLGFAFNESFGIPSWLSMANLIFGLWGLWVVFAGTRK